MERELKKFSQFEMNLTENGNGIRNFLFYILGFFSRALNRHSQNKKQHYVLPPEEQRVGLHRNNL